MLEFRDRDSFSEKNPKIERNRSDRAKHSICKLLNSERNSELRLEHTGSTVVSQTFQSDRELALFLSIRWQSNWSNSNRHRFDETTQTEMKGSVIERIYLVDCPFVKSTSFDTELFAIRIIGRWYALRLLFIRLVSTRARSSNGLGNRFYRELLLSDSLSLIAGRWLYRDKIYARLRLAPIVIDLWQKRQTIFSLARIAASPILPSEIKHAFFVSSLSPFSTNSLPRGFRALLFSILRVIRFYLARFYCVLIFLASSRIGDL